MQWSPSHKNIEWNTIHVGFSIVIAYNFQEYIT